MLQYIAKQSTKQLVFANSVFYYVDIYNGEQIGQITAYGINQNNPNYAEICHAIVLSMYLSVQCSH